MQNEELIYQIELSRFRPFSDHPFVVRDDDAIQQTVESIRDYGVLNSDIVRLLKNGTYEIIAGHRCKHACKLAEPKTMLVVIRDIDRDMATIIMVDDT